MDEENRQDIGDGKDNYSHGARKAAEAAQKFGQSGGKTGDGSTAANPNSGTNTPSPDNPGGGANPAPQQQMALPPGAETSTNALQKGAEAGVEAAAKSAEAGANAAAAAVKAGAESGKAIAEIAAGTAAGGPWGAALSAAWAMRHTLFKILVCACLVLMFLIAMIVSLPAIMFNYIFRTDPASAGVPASYDIHELYEDLANVIADAVTTGHEDALERVTQIIAAGGYDSERSMQALIDISAQHRRNMTLLLYWLHILRQWDSAERQGTVW
jgi:hypothetical protein